MENYERFRNPYENSGNSTKTPSLYDTLFAPNSGGAVMAKTILIIEDETAIQNIVRAFLEDAGYTVYSAVTVWKGLRHSGDVIRTWCCWI